MNKRLASHLQYSWWIYVVVAVLAIALWCGLFSVIYEPSANEKIDVFVLSNKIDADLLEQNLAQNIKKITNQNIKKVGVEAFFDNIENSYTILASRVLSNDLLIIPLSALTPDENDMMVIATNHFSPLPKGVLDMFKFEDGDLFYYKDEAFGIIVGGGNKQTLFDTLYKPDEKYVLFLSAYSKNMDALFGQGVKGDDAAISVLSYILGDRYEIV